MTDQYTEDQVELYDEENEVVEEGMDPKNAEQQSIASVPQKLANWSMRCLIAVSSDQSSVNRSSETAALHSRDLRAHGIQLRGCMSACHRGDAT